MFTKNVFFCTVFDNVLLFFTAARCTNIWAIMIITWRKNPNRALLQSPQPSAL